MAYSPSSKPRSDDPQWAPWTIAGGADPDIDDATRVRHHALLTDAGLLTCFRQRFADRADVDYDEMVRLLGYVWDCSSDGFANVVGFRCGRCGRTRAEALGPSASEQRRVHHGVELLGGERLDRETRRGLGAQPVEHQAEIAPPELGLDLA
jgi:hypothetical protein